MINPLEWKDNKLSYDPKELGENTPYCVLGGGDEIIVVIKKNGKILSYYINDKSLKEE